MSPRDPASTGDAPIAPPTDLPLDPPERVAAQAGMLVNRVSKNLRRLMPWAKRHDVFAFRVYDCDIPELPLSLDRYAVKDGSVHGVLHYYEGRYPHGEAWLEAMREAAAKALETRSEWVRLKIRARQEGASQYTPSDAAGRRLVVEEGGLSFLVDLDGYIDTGLFLDHREARARVRREARGRDVLNLFAYTGAFSVHAASGGAKTTTTVDLSQTYCEWARDNLLLNGFEAALLDEARAPVLGSPHRVIRAEVRSWLGAAPRRAFDLAVVDPPTFSNSKKMVGVLDVQRDHAALLRSVAPLIRPGGVVYFSTNARRFKPDPDAFTPFWTSEEISEESVPFDFRDKKIHRAWRLTLPPSPVPPR